MKRTHSTLPKCRQSHILWVKVACLILLVFLFGNPATVNAQCAPDVTAPVASCIDVTVLLDSMGIDTLMPEDVDGGSFDNCGISSIVVAPNIFACNDVNKGLIVLRFWSTRRIACGRSLSASCIPLW